MLNRQYPEMTTPSMKKEQWLNTFQMVMVCIWPACWKMHVLLQNVSISYRNLQEYTDNRMSLRLNTVKASSASIVPSGFTDGRKDLTFQTGRTLPNKLTEQHGYGVSIISDGRHSSQTDRLNRCGASYFGRKYPGVHASLALSAGYICKIEENSWTFL